MSSDYWQQRREDLLGQMAADEADLSERLAEVYSKEAAALEKEIAAYYQRYGEGNVIEYRKLLASLTDDDRALLMERMDEFAAKYPQYAYLMPVRESIYRLNELEGLQTSIRIQQLEIGAIEQEEMQAHFEQQALRAANLAAEQMGFGSSFYGVNAAIISATVGAAWAQGKSYSERIWDNREKLAAYLSDDFAKAVARGATYESCVKELRQRFESVSRRDAYRLVYTEGTFLFNEAQAQVHRQDFERYRITCVHDGRACKACLALEAEQKANPVRYDDEAPGVNFPPLHPWCRCCAVPAVDDWDAWIDDYVNARGGDAAKPRLEECDDKQLFSDCLKAAIDANPNGGSVDWHTAEEMENWTTFLSAENSFGVAVKPDGDITCVFKNPDTCKAKGVVGQLILTARENGGVKMDCYGRLLVNMYERCGYVPVARVPFDAEYVTDETLLREKPDVYVMLRNNDTMAEATKSYFDGSYKLSTKDELDALPAMNYDEALAYRDSLLGR